MPSLAFYVVPPLRLVPVLVSLLLSLDGLGNAVLGRAGTGLYQARHYPLARGLSQLVGLFGPGVCAVVALPQVTAALSPDWNFFAHAQTPTDPRNALFVGVGVVLLVGYVLADVARAALRRGTQAAAALRRGRGREFLRQQLVHFLAGDIHRVLPGAGLAIDVERRRDSPRRGR